MYRLVVFFFALIIGLTAQATTSILVLSGGANPSGNHYSQYLQTKTLYDNLKVRFPSEVSVLFGAGNADAQQPVLADVHKIQKETSGQSRAVMIPGVIADNKAANQRNALDYLSNLRSQSPDTFFLFVSDHGMPNRNGQGQSDRTFTNNCINLWGFEFDLAQGSFRSTSFAEQCLSQKDLSQQLHDNIPQAKTVFAMSQCFSGGFHQMSVQLNSAGRPQANPQLCGFTAITEDDTASGCTADVDGDSYQGYERYFTEQLTGQDVVSGSTLRPAKVSVEQAHQAAALQDFTKDIPLSTSDYYLLQWAKVLGRDHSQSLAQQSALRSAHSEFAAKPRYAAKLQFFQNMQTQVSNRFPDVASQVDGDLTALVSFESSLRTNLSTATQQMYDLYESTDSYEQVIGQGWMQYAFSSSSSLTPSQKNIENNLFGQGLQPLMVMALKAVSAPTEANEISQYMMVRENLIFQWARQSRDPRVLDAVAQLDHINSQLKPIETNVNNLQKKQGLVRRVLKYRTALGAMSVLLQMKDTAALKDLDGLLDCEASELN
jgi:hypothetical protein